MQYLVVGHFRSKFDVITVNRDTFIVFVPDNVDVNDIVLSNVGDDTRVSVANFIEHMEREED